MRFLYGEAGNSRLQRRLIRAAAPRPRLAYYLDVSPETAHARKQDWTLDQLRVQARLYEEESAAFGAQRLNAELPAVHDVCAEIASESGGASASPTQTARPRMSNLVALSNPGDCVLRPWTVPKGRFVV